MNLVRLDASDERAVAASLAFSEAVRIVDSPWDPPEGPRSFTSFLRLGWDGEPGERWVLHEDGVQVGQLGLNFPKRDNTHMADVWVTVHPEHRRKGHGRALVREGLERARDAGRRLAVSGTYDAPGPVAFAEAMGFTRASVEIRRRQDLTAVDLDAVAGLRANAREAAHDYTLLRVVGAVPDDLLEEVAAITAAINDAPTDDLDIEDEVFDGTRIRQFEAAQEAAGIRFYRLFARLGTDGPLAGHTIVGVNPEQPGHGWQYDTAVAKAHRGHRLGLLLKAEMMAWLAGSEPDVRQVDTWNAESNSHMIGVNEALGYRILNRSIDWQRTI